MKNRNILDHKLCWKEYQLGINHKNIMANHKKQFEQTWGKTMNLPIHTETQANLHYPGVVE